MKVKDNPCNGCQIRAVDCHSVCILYGFREYIHQATKKKEREERITDDIMVESAAERKSRLQKRLRKKKS